VRTTFWHTALLSGDILILDV